MKYCIDTDEGIKQNAPPDLVFYLAALYQKTPMNNQTFQKACSMGLIEFDGFTQQREPINLRLTQSGVDLMEAILLSSEFPAVDAKDRFENLANKMRDIYPKGMKVVGNKSYPWRDSTAMISKKLKALIKRTGAEFTDDEALRATQAYVNSFNGDYKYMRTLRYFISKIDTKLDEQGNRVSEETSELLNYISNVDDIEETIEEVSFDNGDLV